VLDPAPELPLPDPLLPLYVPAPDPVLVDPLGAVVAGTGGLVRAGVGDPPATGSAAWMGVVLTVWDPAGVETCVAFGTVAFFEMRAAAAVRWGSFC
jgi:hypothetical protein